MFFDRSIDSKQKYTDKNGTILVDLGESIFKDDQIFAGVPISIYRVAYGMDMRADLVSLAAYGDNDSCEILLKYNNIQNPFTIQENDVIVVPTSVHMNKHIGVKTTEQKLSQDSLIRQFHKYVDDKKVPETPGSEQNTTSVPKTNGNIKGGPTSNGYNVGVGSSVNGASGGVNSGVGTKVDNYKEANLASLGAHAIKEIDGKLYFGSDSEMKCATDGVNTADYLKTVINNTLKNNKK